MVHVCDRSPGKTTVIGLDLRARKGDHAESSLLDMQ